MEATVEAQVPQTRLAFRLAVATLLLLIAAGVGLFLMGIFDSAQTRVEREHGISLPESARDIQAMGDASNQFLRLINLDRGASSILVIDRPDLDELLQEFGFDEQSDNAGRFLGGAPGNAQYQPSSVPWPEGLGASPVSDYGTDNPPSNGDFATLQVYTIDDSSVGVWLYTDWN
ncbi:MAG: hypothetical protein ACRBK7_21310 [Acidimicrobiales bacterium]